MKSAMHIAVALLLVAVLGLISKPLPVLAVSPVFKIFVVSQVPGAENSHVDFDGDGSFNDEGPLVETDWGHTGSVLKVRVESGGMAANDADDTRALISVSSKNADAFFGPILVTERSTGTAVTDDGFIQFDLILSPHTTTGFGNAPYVGPGNELSIRVNNDDEVTIVIEPASGPPTIDVARSITIGVENTDPRVYNVDPADGGVVGDEDANITFSLYDRISGIPQPEDKPDSDGDDEYSSSVILISDSQCTESEIYTSISNGNIATGGYTCAGATSAIGVVTVDDENDFDDITDGFDVDTHVFLTENRAHYFTIVTFDSAGNFDVFDGDPTSSNTMAKVTVDTASPTLSSAFPPRTGVGFNHLWDEFNSENDWIQLLVMDSSALNPITIEDTDFAILGHTVRRVLWFDFDPEEISGGPDSSSPNAFGPKDANGARSATCFNAAGTATSNCNVIGAQIPRPDSWFLGGDNPNIAPAVPDGNGVYIIRNSIFIQLEDELAGDETPIVTIVIDGVMDVAGNLLVNVSEFAEDWIAPTFTVESIVTPNSPALLVGAGQQAEIIFTADEAIDGDPDVTVTLVNDVDLNDISNVFNVSVTEIGRNRWRTTIPSSTNTGFYSIYFSGRDDQGIFGELGVEPSNIASDFFYPSGTVNRRDAVFIEADLSLPMPSLSIQDGEEVVAVEGVVGITIDFANPPSGANLSEDEEYFGDSFRDVTITKFEVDGQDRLSDVASANQHVTAALSATTESTVMLASRLADSNWGFQGLIPISPLMKMIFISDQSAIFERQQPYVESLERISGGTGIISNGLPSFDATDPSDGTSSRTYTVAAVAGPQINVYRSNGVPGADITTVDFEGDGGLDPLPLVETAWAKDGTVLKVMVRGAGISSGDGLNTLAGVTIQSSAAPAVTLASRTIAENDFGPVDDGILQFEIELNNSSSSSPVGGDHVGSGDRFVIQVQQDDQITATVSPTAFGTGENTVDDVGAITVRVENDAPVLSSVTPVDGAVLDDEVVAVSFTTTDTGSGIPQPEDMPDTDGDGMYSSSVILISDAQCTEAEIHTHLADGSISSGAFSACSNGVSLDVVSISDSTDFVNVVDGFDVDTNIFLSENRTHFFTIVTFDAAGNFDVYDGEASSANTMAKVVIDTQDPNLKPAFPPRTGVAFDPSANEFREDRLWMQVIIVDSSDIDPSTLDVSDFVVEGHVVQSVHWFDVDPEDMAGGPGSGSSSWAAGPKDIGGSRPATCFNTSGTTTVACNTSGATIPKPDSWFPAADNPAIALLVPDNNGVFQIRNSVFLELTSPLSPDETPSVTIVPNGVDDEAGNNLSLDDEVAEDWIAPRITLESISTPNAPDLLAGQDDQTLLIFVSDEDIDGDPNVMVTFVDDSDLLSSTDNDLNTTMQQIGTNRWRAYIDRPNDTGLYNIWITGDDVEGNGGHSNSINPAGGLSDFFESGNISSNAIFFEGDVDTHSPRIAVAGQELEFDQFAFTFHDPFVIQLNFDETASSETTNEGDEYFHDGFGEAFLDLAELDGIDVTGLASTTDNTRYSLNVPSIAEGIHELVVLSSDKVGNQALTKVNFEIVASGGPNPINEFLASITGLSAGPHSLRLNAMDEAGNQLPQDIILSFTVASAADLKIETTASSASVEVGQQLTYTSTVVNTGPIPATNVVLIDTLPSGVSFVSAEPSAQCSEVSDVVTCSFGDLSVAESAVSTILVTADVAGSITNIASVSGTGPDLNQANNADSVTTITTDIVTPPPPVTTADLRISQVRFPNPVLKNQELTYRVAVTNDGPSTAAAVEIIDTLPSSVSFVSSRPTASCSQAFGVATCDIGDMTPGQSFAIEIVVLPNTVGSITNTAVVQTTSDDPTASNNISTLTIDVLVPGIIESTAKIVTLSGEGEAVVGDQYFVVLSSPNSTSTFVGPLLAPMIPIDRVPNILRRMHSLDSVGSAPATHVYLGEVGPGPSGVRNIDITIIESGGATSTLSTPLDVVDMRSNRNYFLMPGTNYVGLGQVPGNTSLATLHSKPVPNVNPAFEQELGRAVTLADVIEKVYAFSDDGSFLTYFTADPITGLEGPANTLSDLAPYQGMIIITRESVAPDDGGPHIDVFDQVAMSGQPDPQAVPIKMTILGTFLDIGDGTAATPITKTMRFGWNLVAPHVQESALFDVVFANALNPKQLTASAITLTREVTADSAQGISASLTSKFRTVIEGGQVLPEWAYWIFIADTGNEIDRPVMVPLALP